MKIAFLCKRHYSGKDVILDRYGRLYELPRQLALLGHEVTVWCLAYRNRDCGEGIWEHDAAPGTLRLISNTIGGRQSFRAPGHPYRMLRDLRAFGPDIVMGASDIPHVVLTTWLARRLGTPCVLDLYDNFESFGQARIPGFRYLLKDAVLRADLIIAVSDALKEKVLGDRAPAYPVEVMPNGTNTSLFTPGNRTQARVRLNLPLNARLIGTAGGLSRMKGLDVVYEGWRRLSSKRPDVHLVLAGPVDPGLPLPRGSRVHYLGELTEAQVADLFRALEVGIITVPDTPFGRYCFPQKAYEMLACSLPVVCSDVGAMRALFSDTPEIRFPPDDPDALAGAVDNQLQRPVLPDIPIRDWEQLVRGIEPLLPSPG